MNSEPDAAPLLRRTIVALFFGGLALFPLGRGSITLPDADGAQKKAVDNGAKARVKANDADDDSRPKKVVKTDSEWMKILSREQFKVTRKNGTERPYTGKLWKDTKDGVYECVCCGQPLFDSKSKYDAKNGYPCFNDPIDENAITIAGDKKRVECSRCDANLGQVLANGGQAPGASAPPGGGAPAAGHAAPPAGGQQGPAGGQQGPGGGQQPPAGRPSGPAAGHAAAPGRGQQAPGGGQQTPGGGQPGPAGEQPRPPGAQVTAERYCLYNQAIKFVPRADVEKTTKKSK